MKRRTFLAGGLAAASTLAMPALADTLDTIRSRKKLLVALDLGSPPFGMTDAAMQPTGSDVETARLLAADWELPLEIVQVTSPNRVPFLLTGKADMVIASFSVNEERQKVIDFSDPYGVIQAVIAGRRTARSRITRPSSASASAPPAAAPTTRRRPPAPRAPRWCATTTTPR